MKRKLSLIEGTMYAGGKTAVNVVSSVTIKGAVQESDLHASLLKIQARHPLLSSNVWKMTRVSPILLSRIRFKELPSE